MDMNAMNQTIELPSGIKLEAPLARLSKYYTDNYVVLYDQFPTKANAPLALPDILISVMIDSRIRPAAAARLYDQLGEIEGRLGAIPSDLALTSSAVRWEDVEALLDACRVNGVDLAVATKVIHKKRPELFPLIDSVLENAYRDAPGAGSEPWPKECGKRGVRVMKMIRRDLTPAVVEQIDELRSWLQGDKKIKITRVRTLDALIWIEKSTSKAAADFRR